MLQTGRNFENIVEMLNNFRGEVQTLASLGLLNINKHAENFIMTLLNLTYNYELENLNKNKANFPGLDLGDVGDGIAFQISSTKKSEKIDDTLSTCLEYKHYESFKNINVFILTKKQSSYTLKIVTEPFFTFSAERNILDFDDLLRKIEHVSQSKMQAIHDYIKKEVNPVINLIKNSTEADGVRLLDTEGALTQSKMSTYVVWQARVIVANQNMTVPDIFSKLHEFLPNPPKKIQFLPMLNPAIMARQSGKEILFLHALRGTAIANQYSGYAMLLEPSRITVETAAYSDQEQHVNLLSEMVTLLTQLLFFDKYAKHPYEIQVSIRLEANTIIYFSPQNSLVIDRVMTAFKLESPLEVNETITDIETSTLTDLLQNIMHGFISHEPSFMHSSPFLTIDRNASAFVINNIKKELVNVIV